MNRHIMRGTYQHLLCSQRSGKERERSTSAACFFFYVAPPPRQHLQFFPLSLSRALHTHIHQQQHRKATKKKSIVFGKSQQRQPTERRMLPRNSPSFRHKQHEQNETKTKKAKDENRSTKHTHAGKHAGFTRNTFTYNSNAHEVTQ